MSVTVEEIVIDWIDRKITRYPELKEKRENLISEVSQKLEERSFQDTLDARAEVEGKIAMRMLIDGQFGKLLSDYIDK